MRREDLNKSINFRLVQGVIAKMYPKGTSRNDDAEIIKIMDLKQKTAL